MKLIISVIPLTVARRNETLDLYQTALQLPSADQGSIIEEIQLWK